LNYKAIKTHLIGGIVFVALIVQTLFANTPPIAVSTSTTQSSNTSQANSTAYLPALIAPGFPRVPSLVGAEFQAFYNDDSFQKTNETGLSWLRSNNNAVIWSEIEPSEGNYNWNAPSLKLAEEFWKVTSANNIFVIQIVRSTPQWARKYDGAGATCGPIAATKLQAFANFMGQLVARYSQAPYNVKYWEIGNEPDGPIRPTDEVFGCWGEPTDKSYYGGAYFGEMLKVVYPKIKAANGNVQVVMGGLLLDCDPRNPPKDKDCTPARFLEGMLVAGAGSSFDIVNVHAYDSWIDSSVVGHYNNPNWNSAWNTTGPSILAKVNYLRDTLSRFGYGNKAIMNTESAMQCWCKGVSYDVTILDESKSVYLTQSNVVALSLGLLANVWYGIQGWEGHETQLINGNGITNRAYVAYKASVKKLGNATYRRLVTDYGSAIRIYEFNRDNKRVWAVWSLDGVNRSILLTTQPTGIFDMYGEAITVTTTPSFTNRPIYIEFSR
jgi:hypothetical protein